MAQKTKTHTESGSGSSEVAKKTKSKNWCWTLNNPTENSFDDFTDDLYSYSVVGKEVGDSGTPHAQGYTVFKKEQRLSAVKKLLPRAHWEVRQGSHVQASDYCKKDGDFMEDGTPPVSPHEKGGAATKRKWEEVWQASVEGRIGDIDAKTRFLHYKNIKAIRKDHMEKPADLQGTCGEWHYGEAGTGKTTAVRTEYPDAFIKSRDKWWCGYQGEDTVIMDDMDPFCKALSGNLKDWGDRWSFKAEEKGGCSWIRPERFIVTSQYSIEDIFEDDETRLALNRRFKKTHYNKQIK